MPWDAQGRWIPEDDSVATRLTGLLGSGSQYIQQARAAGTRTAGRRGLLNSSLAAGAAEGAAIGAAAPIASQDASQTFQRNQAVLEGGINLNNQTTLNEQQNAATRDRDAFNLTGQMTMQEREAGFAKERLALEQQGATAQQLREFDQRTAEQTRNIAAEAAGRTETLSSQERQNMMQADVALTQTQVQSNAQLSGQYLTAFSQLASDPNIPANVRNAYIAEFQRVMQQGQQLINVLGNTPISWNGSTPATPAPAPPPPPPPPPPAPAPAPAPPIAQAPPSQTFRRI